nr:TlpA disulfide reductase family protein [Legionella massiliensis]
MLSFLLYISVLSHAFCSTVFLKDVTGQIIPFDSLKGKWVLLNYWASWCQPCLDEIVELNHFYKKNKDKVALFAVNFDLMPLPSQIALIRKYKISYPSLQFDPARALDLGDIRGVPATFVFNPDGKLSTTLYGGQTEKSLKEAIR